MQICLTDFHPSAVEDLGAAFSGTNPAGDRLCVNSYYFELNGRPILPVSGELHFSRLDPIWWEDELIKMRMGGVNIVSTYVFWNHIEEEEGTFDFSGRRNLRAFVRLCAKHGLYVILRIGPFAHGEARNGGLPDWLYGKPYEVRTTQPGFMACVKRLYSHIAGQVSGLFFRDGGPIIALQLDNEYMHAGAVWEMTTGISNEWVHAGHEGETYLIALRDTALECGMCPVFFTSTAWGGAAYSDQILPLWGGYAYRPWLFYSHSGEHPATEEYVYEDYHHNGVSYADDFTPLYAPQSRPYACCEMGGGMMCCYYYRFRYPYKSVDALANIKLGSGCNFVGYYMFHGGTNPLGIHGGYLNESQVTKISYDYQAALGESGQVRESYRRLKSLHYFLRSFGDRLAPMETVLPDGASRIDPRDTDTLRFAVRTDGHSGFLFVNNFQDHAEMPARVHDHVCVQTRDGAFTYDISLAPGENAVLPFRFDVNGICLLHAQAQPLLRTAVQGRTVFVFMVPDGMDGSFAFEEGTMVTGDEKSFTVRKGERSAEIIVVNREEADRLFLLRDGSLVLTSSALLEDEKGLLRLETTQEENTVLCYPPSRLEDADATVRLEDQGPFGAYLVRAVSCTVPLRVEPAAPFRYLIHLQDGPLAGCKHARLRIRYRGDTAMLFLGNRMISDNFCNGDVWETSLMEHRAELAQPLVLKITPVRKGSHVNVESAMAARNEEVKENIAELLDVQVQCVYEIRLYGGEKHA